MESKKIFVTGGTGLVGSHVIKALLQAGYKDILALKRNKNIPSDLKTVADWRQGNILDFQSLLDHMAGCDTVIHCAAAVSFKQRDRKLLQETNVEGTRSVINAAIQVGVKEFVHLSSVAVFGRDPNSKKAITEQTEWNDDLYHTHYAASKYQAELEVWRAMAEGLNIGIINPSIVLGSSDWDVGSSYIFKYASRGPKYYPSGSSGFVDVRDVAAFIVKLMTKGLFGERYLLNGFHASHRELLNLICEQFGVSSPKKAFIGFPFRLAKVLAWLQAYVFRSESSLTLDSLRTSAQKNMYNAEKSEATGFGYRNIQDTIKYCCTYYSDKYNLNR